jgi:hypothetical protein
MANANTIYAQKKAAFCEPDCCYYLLQADNSEAVAVYPTSGKMLQ